MIVKFCSTLCKAETLFFVPFVRLVAWNDQKMWKARRYEFQGYAAHHRDYAFSIEPSSSTYLYEACFNVHVADNKIQVSIR